MKKDLIICDFCNKEEEIFHNCLNDPINWINLFQTVLYTKGDATRTRQNFWHVCSIKCLSDLSYKLASKVNTKGQILEDGESVKDLVAKLDGLVAKLDGVEKDFVALGKLPNIICPICKGRGYRKCGFLSRRFELCDCKQ